MEQIKSFVLHYDLKFWPGQLKSNDDIIFNQKVSLKILGCIAILIETFSIHSVHWTEQKRYFVVWLAFNFVHFVIGSKAIN